MQPNVHNIHMYVCLYVFVWIVALTFCSGWHFFLLLLILFVCDAIAQTGKEFLYITLWFAFALRRFSLHAFVILLCVRMYVFFFLCYASKSSVKDAASTLCCCWNCCGVVVVSQYKKEQRKKSNL